MLSDAIAKMSELIVVNDFRDPSKIRYPVIPTITSLRFSSFPESPDGFFLDPR